MGADDPTLPESPRARRTSQSLDLVVILGEQLCVDAGLAEGDPRRDRIFAVARRLYDIGRDAGRSEERRAMAAGAIGGLQQRKGTPT